MNQPEWKLYYFIANARAAVIRAILYSQKIEFEDNRIALADWPQLKSSGKFEFGQVPVLEHNGKLYTQSHAIEQYLAKQFGLHGNNPEEEYEITSLLHSFNDFFPNFRVVVFPKTDSEKAAVEENKTKLKEDKLPFFLKIYEARYLKNGSGSYFLGDRFTLADIWLTVTLFNVCLCPGRNDDYEQIMKDNAPKLYELIGRVSQAELVEYFKNGYVYDAAL